MNYNAIKQKIANLKKGLYSTNGEIEAESNTIKREIDQLFRKTMKPAGAIIRKMEAAERQQQLERVIGLGKQFDELAKEGALVGRLYDELFAAARDAASKIRR